MLDRVQLAAQFLPTQDPEPAVQALLYPLIREPAVREAQRFRPMARRHHDREFLARTERLPQPEAGRFRLRHRDPCRRRNRIRRTRTKIRSLAAQIIDTASGSVWRAGRVNAPG